MNTHLKTKSDQNFNLAKNVISSNGPEFASSIHCSYYSCVQLMLHILRSHFNKSDDDVEESHQQENGSTHTLLIKEIGKELKRLNFNDFREFNFKIKELKGVRVKSDYKNESIEKIKAEKALNYAQDINFALRKNFNI